LEYADSVAKDRAAAQLALDVQLAKLKSLKENISTGRIKLE
jgi:hypothetical protein